MEKIRVQETVKKNEENDRKRFSEMDNFQKILNGERSLLVENLEPKQSRKRNDPVGQLSNALK